MDGIIIINKPKGCTSHDVVHKIKKITGKKVGHTGTLDPNATGVLPILIGKGTLLSKYLINHDKTYEVLLKLGEKTDTADSEGKVIETKDVNNSLLKNENVLKVFNSFLGKQQQIPPMYSAIKVNGKKLYEYARKGQNVEIKPREIEIYNINLIKNDIANKEIVFKVDCSKGTYVRSLCESIAEKLNTVGYMKELNRIRVGEFTINQAISLTKIDKIIKQSLSNESNNILLGDYMISIESFFKNHDSIKLNNNRLNPFLNGVMLKYSLNDGVYRIYNEKDEFIGTGTIKNDFLKRDIILKNIEKI